MRLCDERNVGAATNEGWNRHRQRRAATGEMHRPCDAPGRSFEPHEAQHLPTSVPASDAAQGRSGPGATVPGSLARGRRNGVKDQRQTGLAVLADAARAWSDSRTRSHCRCGRPWAEDASANRMRRRARDHQHGHIDDRDRLGDAQLPRQRTKADPIALIIVNYLHGHFGAFHLSS